MEQKIAYYLGANSSEGFCSFYEELFRDSRVKRIWIIKGGPGNGKSTFMRTLGRTAERRGVQTEQILCSSDPDSLDGILIPAIGLAVVDGTAPHVVEPILCGMESRYLDFSACYREGMEGQKEEILQVMRANKRCYAPAYACLSAAGTLRRRMAQEAQDGMDREAVSRLVQTLIEAELPPSEAEGGSIRRFFDAVTPYGIRSGLATVRALSTRLYLLDDSHGIAGEVLHRLRDAAIHRGCFCITGHSPLLPKRIDQLLIPALGVAFARTEPSSRRETASYCRLDLDALSHPTEQQLAHLWFLRSTAEELEREAVTHLKEAKAHHDRLEKLCRPYVNFDQVNAMQEQYAAQVQTMLDKAL